MERTVFYLLLIIWSSGWIVPWASYAHGPFDFFNTHNVSGLNKFQIHRDVLPQVSNVHHLPGKGLEDHNYFDGNKDRWVRELIVLVEHGHVDKVLPSLRKATYAPKNLKLGYYKAALADLKYTLKRIVNHPRALMLLENVAGLLGRKELPKFYYLRALALYPRNALTHAQFGKYLMDSGKITESINLLENALKIDSRLGVAYGWLSWAYKKNGNQVLAVQLAEKAKSLGYKGKLPNY